MSEEIEYSAKIFDASPFSEIAGEEVVNYITETAPKKVLTRVAKALNHYVKAERLVNVDEEMGAIRLIACEEELVVAIFEMLKLKDNAFPEHKDFVRKYKNHVVKLAFYPALSQFRFIIEEMLSQGFVLQSLEGLMNWTAKPVIERESVKLALYKDDGTEVIRVNPLAIAIMRDDIEGHEISDALLIELKKMVESQQNQTLRQFLFARADYRNKLLYATDDGSVEMGDKLTDLIELCKQSFHDLLWTLAIIIGSEPTHKNWGLANQFINLYRLALADVGSLGTRTT